MNEDVEELRDSLALDLWDNAVPIYEAILGHSFVRELGSGTLPRKSFAYYLQQDTYYLRSFARALLACGAREADDQTLRLLIAHAADAVEWVRGVQRSLAQDFGPEDADSSAAPGAITLAYGSYIVAVAFTRPFSEAIAALLPCLWIYQKIGRALEASASPVPLYRSWITSYASDEYKRSVDEVLDLVNEIGASLTSRERAEAGDCFLASARYEGMFLDMAYRREPWPKPIDPS